MQIKNGIVNGVLKVLGKLQATTIEADTITGNLTGNADTATSATKATKDSANQQINTTYIKGLSASGTTITYTKGDGTTGTITTQDNNTDTKVTNTLATTTKAYVTGTTSANTNTGTQVFDTGVYLDTIAGQLTATTFKGALSGNASTATSATTASKLGTNAGSASQAVYFSGGIPVVCQTNLSSHTVPTITTSRGIDGVNFNGSADIIHYGTCSTAAATAAKTVALTNYKLVTGSSVKVKFTVTNTASNPTLNVNSTGAKAIMYRGSAIPAGYLAANRVYEFIYDGTDYELVGDINTDSNTTYSAGTGISLSGTTFSLPNSGVTAGTYGPTANVTGNHDTTINIPQISVDAQGRVTAVAVRTLTNKNNTYTALKNPNSLTIQGNGTTLTNGTYDGSADKIVNITPAVIGAATSAQGAKADDAVRKTGGSATQTITASTNYPLTLYYPSTSAAVGIAFQNNNGILGYIRHRSAQDDGLYYVKGSDTSTIYKMWTKKDLTMSLSGATLTISLS